MAETQRKQGFQAARGLRLQQIYGTSGRQHSEESHYLGEHSHEFSW